MIDNKKGETDDDSENVKNMESNASANMVSSDYLSKNIVNLTGVSHVCARMQELYDEKMYQIIKHTEMKKASNETLFQKSLKGSAYLGLCSYLSNQQKNTDSILKSIKIIKSDAASCLSEKIVSAIKSYYSSLADSIYKSLNRVAEESLVSLRNSIKNIVSSYRFGTKDNMKLLIQQMLQNIDYSPLFAVFNSNKWFDFDKYKERLNEIVCIETYDAKWMPHALCVEDRDRIVEFWEILSSTRKSKNRIKKIDLLVFGTYNKSRIEKIRKGWREKNVPQFKMRIMNQAVQAYHRKEYAITVVMLSTMWEGIIYEKADDERGRQSERTKTNYQELVLNADYDQLCISFFDEYIMYDCRSEESVIDDVPGRHGSAHSWYKKYPSRKAALNAIIFTDFLLNL